MGAALTHCAYVWPRHKVPSAGPPSFSRRDAGNADAGRVQRSLCVMLAQCYMTAKAQRHEQYNGSCYSCLVERILKRRSSAPSALRHKVPMHDSYSTALYSIRTCEHLISWASSLVAESFCMYLITGVHGAVSRTARPLDPPGETKANKVEDVERTFRWVCVGNSCRSMLTLRTP